MAVSTLTLRAMAYVPGLASGVLQRDTTHPGSIAMVEQMEALNPTTRPAAFIIVDGAPLSHSMIELVAQGIPTVFIDAAQARLLKPGTEVWVDGATGLITTGGGEMSPPTHIPPVPEAGHPVLLADRTEVWLMASVRSVAQAHQALISGASGIGLVRSEFLGWDELQPPDVACLTEKLEALCTSADRLVVTVRLVDIAADKQPRWLPEAQHILRPFGMQGARLFQREPIRSVVRNQLVALAKLSDHFAFEVLIPYIGRREELLHWVEFVRQSLPQNVPVGAMAETPAAVLDLANWGDLVDFFAVGSNDLMQCVFGADRDEPGLRGSLDPYAPALYRLLEQVVISAGDYQDRVRLCGVLPRLTGVLRVLVGLGFRRFSVDPVWIPYLADDLRTFNAADAEDLACRLCACRDSREVLELLGLS